MKIEPNLRSRSLTLLTLWILSLTALICAARDADGSAEWRPTTWNGEQALASTSSGWKAIVSLDRARLVHFSRADRDANLLFAPATKEDVAGWGGHRLWLGPQSTWSGGWPPPAAWEHSAAKSFSQADGTLRLVLPDAGDGWPHLVRTYHWNGDRLACTAEFSGGSRGAQFIHIIQVPSSTVVMATASPAKAAPSGYVLLPSTVTPRLMADFNPPPHLTRTGDNLMLRHVKKVMKLGFVPQGLTGKAGAFGVTMSRASSTEASEPDHGFFTQVYLGGPEPFIELEQLSPMFTPGNTVTFTFELQGTTF